MMRLLLAGFLALGATALSADPVVIRTGEHPGFTRVVLDVPAGTGWSLTRNADLSTARITLDRRSGFDLSNAFLRIRRDRIADLVQIAPDSVEFALNCACDVSAQLLQGTMLVVDFADPPVDRPRQSAEPLPLFFDADDTGLDTAAQMVRAAPAFDPPMRDAALEAPDEDLPVGLRNLAVRLTEAAAQGILTADDSAGPDLSPVAEAENGQPGDDTPALASAPLAVRLEPDDRIRIGSRCTPDAELDLPSWGNAERLFDDLAAARLALARDLDVLDSAALTDLARLYLFAGFGAEARAALSLIQGEAPAALLGLADLLDGRPGSESGFEGQSACPGRAALWGSLAQTSATGRIAPEDRSVLEAFEELPAHLKSYLAPRLAERLTIGGRTDLAKDVLNRQKRDGAVPPVDALLVQARIDAEAGAIDDANARLQDAVDRSPAIAPKALTVAADLIADGAEVAIPTDSLLTQALASELRDTDLASGVLQSQVYALMDAGAFAEAYALIDAEEETDSGSAAVLWPRLFTRLAKDADDATFLSLILASQNDWSSKIPDDLRPELAERLLSLGMAETALAMTQTVSGSESRRAVQLLRAAAYLRLRQPEDAEIALIGLRGPDVLRLRAEARAMMGDYDFAKTAHESLGDNEAAARAAWMAGDLQDLPVDVGGLYEAASRLSAEPIAPPQTTEPSLQDVGTLIEQSQTARSALADLLSESRLDDGG
ncbi:hypothetical protein KUH32_06145 [Thalassococcus sp. CAU 1522]|uniref:Tetratricopeptide repeat-containing protein n=1 Tax=Thalassococcus arenae TaxID=2851652 RepID=A0ABS6N5R2_9RHOB|nr:hypothetical protein [Thalassococcus arenae]MBV2359345.1 hypothetical protein [Thalassococcus arenae]